MLAEILLGGVLGLALLAMLGFVEFLRRRHGVETEKTRKLAHLCGGIALLALPWLFTTLWVPALLAAAFLGVLAISKRKGWLPSVHGIERRSSGAPLFPIAAFLTLVLADGDHALFVVPMLILAVSDAAAAIVGRRYGRRKFYVVDQSRSLEGSLAFLVTAFVVTLPALVLTGTSPALALPIAIVLALLLTGIEAICIGGLDNFVIPVAALFLLTSFRELEPVILWGHIVVLLALLATAVASFRRRGLSFSASLAALLLGYAALAIGGVEWFAPLLVVWWVLKARSTPRSDHDAENDRHRYALPLRRVLAFSAFVGAALLVHGTTEGSPAVFGGYLALMGVVLAVALARRVDSDASTNIAVFAAPIIIVALAVALPSTSTTAPELLLGAALSSFAGFGAFTWLRKKLDERELERAVLLSHASTIACYLAFAALIPGALS